jgi:8-oxo-dGTP diphosphatase
MSLGRRSDKLNMIKQVRREFAPTMILHDEGRFLLQQGDDIAGIFYPGKIGLFGGHREGNETFLDCAVRELHEELGYYIAPDSFEFLACYEGPDLPIQGGTLCVNFFVVRNFSADRLVVSEGKPLLVSPSELGVLEEKLTHTTRCALKAFFEKYPASSVSQARAASANWDF